MKILTWNINGIRASKVPLKQLFDSLDADIICLQETKVTRDMLDERSAIVDGYSSYYSFSNARTGYSGVATYVRDGSTPVKAEQGLSGDLTTDEDSAIGQYGDHGDFTEEELELLDREGRTIITQHMFRNEMGKETLLTVINVYCPRADPEREDRKTFKLRFYQLLQIRAEALLKSGSHVIILGDVNTSHQRIDTCDPSEPAEFVKNPCRIWLNQLLWVPDAQDLRQNSPSETNKPVEDNKPEKNITIFDKVNDTSGRSCGKFIDSFRYFHPGRTEAYTCWNTMIGARETNYGTRIDYIFVDKDMGTTQLIDCNIMPEVMGSDHCPVKAHLKFSLTPAKKFPPLCTKYFPEFVGVQTKLSAFFTKGVKRSASESESSSCGSKDITKSTDTVVDTHQRDGSSLNLKSTSQPPPTKKAKVEKPCLTKKQSNLAYFFGAKPVANKGSGSKVSTNHENVTKSHSTVHAAGEKGLPKESFDWVKTDIVGGSQSKNSTSAWKNLLKGPPPAPLCKGHKEPCLLRTVKKDDSLNKGRQFYVCPRPEGHKTNPQARCDHFEWVEKRKKPK